jgi:hypothetical protein
VHFLIGLPLTTNNYDMVMSDDVGFGNKEEDNSENFK